MRFGMQRQRFVIAIVLPTLIAGCSDGDAPSKEVARLHGEVENLRIDRDRLKAKLKDTQVDLDSTLLQLNLARNESERAHKEMESLRSDLAAFEQREEDVSHAQTVLTENLRRDMAIKDRIRKIAEESQESFLDNPIYQEVERRVQRTLRQLDYIEAYRKLPPPEYAFRD